MRKTFGELRRTAQDPAKLRKPIDPTMVAYPNTRQHAQAIGWANHPEFCVGDPSARYVLHDHVAGKFYFTDDPKGGFWR